MGSNFAQCRHYTNFKWPYFRTAGGHYRHMVGHAASPICIADTNVTFTSSKVKINSLTFWSFENCTFLRLLPTLFSGGAHDWWVITIVWDIVTTFRSHISEFLPHLVVTWLRTSRNVDITRRGWKLNTFTLSWMILSAFYCACAELEFFGIFYRSRYIFSIFFHHFVIAHVLKWRYFHFRSEICCHCSQWCWSPHRSLICIKFHRHRPMHLWQILAIH